MRRATTDDTAIPNHAEAYDCAAGDPDLRAMIALIRAVDHHAHTLPARMPDPSEADRPDPLGQTPFPYPVRLRVTNPEYLDAWRALYGYPYDDMADAHAREALRTKLSLMVERGEGYPAWVLDQAGVDVQFVNMPGLGPGQTAPRFRWVPHAQDVLSPREAARARGCQLPATLDAYLNDVVLPQLEEWQAAGAVAIKFGIAYHRSLDVAAVTTVSAAAAYGHLVRAGSVTAEDTKSLEDYLFRATAREAGRLGLPVHIHTGVGADPRFAIAGANPLLLEPTFDDPALRDTTFVMLHGGWPFEREAGVMLMKPNVYADFSSQTFLRSTRALSEVLEAWLGWYPEKILFGTDAYPDDTPLASWEEKLWLTTRSSRDALTLALTRMLRSGEITQSRAESLAQMVLRENALGLYDLA